VPRPSRLLWHSLVVIAVIASGSVLTLISLRRAQREAHAPENRPVQSAIANYVTSSACRACHPGNYASWHTSFHRTMTQVATPASLLRFSVQREFSFNGREYKIEREGGKFFVRTRPAGGNYGDQRQIVLVTGSHTLQVPWLETRDGRTLEQFPFAYIIAEKMWAPVNQTFLMPPELKEYYGVGAWNGACMDCHVTQGQSRFVAGSKWDSRVAEFGIACEACHGEGREHITLNRNPVRRFKIHLTNKLDASVTNPAHLSGPVSGLDCGQCHSVWAFKDMTDKIDFNRHGAAFRPGQRELKQRFVVQPSAPDHGQQKDFIRETEPDFFRNRFWGDGMIRVTGREFNGLQASPCFRGGNFSCISCHEMHPSDLNETSLTKWAHSGQLRPKMDTDEACLQCHKAIGPNISAHTHHVATSSGSRCYNCHMPKNTFGLLHAMRGHQVSSPTVQESIDYGRPNACNLCHLNKTLAWTGEKLHAWYNQPVPPLSPDDQTIAAAVEWIVKGDAGQRALIAWGMGWEPAQKASGSAWLYPYLIYIMSDPYAAIRFEAWKSLQTLPGFSDFSFAYTADDRSVADATAHAMEKWLRKVREPNAVFPPETALEADGRFEENVFRRLRSERDDKPILLAE
jgi:Doubled CXXCH motif (Paired_CXXCH_1)/Cytochrome c554 and c-prime